MRSSLNVLEWGELLPPRWGVSKLKYLADVFPSNVDKKSYAGQEEVLLCNYTDVYYNDKITRNIDFMQATATRDQVERFTLKAGDTIITKDSETADDIAIPAYVFDDLPGVVCGYHLAVIRPRQGVCGAFVSWWFRSRSLKASVHVRANGLTRVGLGQYALENLKIPVPPLAEQTAIAAFLDRETSKIDALVEEQKRLIELLKEKRQAVISHAVTKGLDPNVRMKPSGVEWLGDVPEHWELVRLASLYRFVKRQNGDDYEVLSVYRDYGFIPKASRDDNINKTPDDLSKYQTVLAGDLVINKMKAWQGSLGVSDQVGITSPDYAVFEPVHAASDQYLNLLLRCSLLPDVYRSISNGIRPDQWRIEPDKLRELRLPLPPVEEQEAIARYLVVTAKALDALHGTAEDAIALLVERRSALISAAVTGKIDVRNFAAQEEAA